MATETTIPPGYWKNAAGNLIPESKVKDIDKLRHQVVTDLCQMAKQRRDGVKSGGEKGNVTLTSFDGKYKLVRQMQDRIVFGEQLMAAKALIDECVQEWSQGANDNMRVLVNHAFQTDKEGKINTGRVLGLRSLAIADEAWQQAMQAIADSMQTASTTPYVRFYERDEGTGEYKAISLDVAAV
jgi:hypothetical protein